MLAVFIHLIRNRFTKSDGKKVLGLHKNELNGGFVFIIEREFDFGFCYDQVFVVMGFLKIKNNEIRRVR